MQKVEVCYAMRCILLSRSHKKAIGPAQSRLKMEDLTGEA